MDWPGIAAGRHEEMALDHLNRTRAAAIHQKIETLSQSCCA